MEVRLTDEDINRILVDAVAKSSIGESLNKAIQRVLADLNKSYSNPFDESIKQLLVAEGKRVIEVEYGEQIRAIAAERVRSTLTDEVIAAVIKRASDAAIRAIDNSRY